MAAALGTKARRRENRRPGRVSRRYSRSFFGGLRLGPRGSSLVISARFGGEPPAEAAMVLVSASGKTQRIPLERHLADPVFGASLSEVAEEAHYHVEYKGGKSPDYK